MFTYCKVPTTIKHNKNKCCFLISDQLESEQTEDECLHDFLRLNSTNQMVNSLFSNSISYDAFRQGYFIGAWDLTTSQDGGGLSFVSPSIRIGNVLYLLNY